MSDELVAEWVEKAEEDRSALDRLVSGPLVDVANVICFHAQQCAEKYLKALIQREGFDPPRTHDLPTLLDVLTTAHQGVQALRAACESPTPYAVDFRYPGEDASDEDALGAIDHAKAVRNAVRSMLGLPE